MIDKLVTVILGLTTSKTFWVNAGYAVIALLDFFCQTDFIKSNPDIAALVVAVSNILLRVITKVPLTGKVLNRVRGV